MTITSNDIKIFQAQDNTDNDSGGGSRTAVEIIDGDINNLFPDISRIDTVSGDVALRKVFPTVFTDNRDLYYGAHSIIRRVPSDSKVSSLLFYTGNPHDKRVDAQNEIESYVVASYLEEFWLYGNHIKGAKAVTFLQNVESQLPDVGNVYKLVENGVEQYIRVEDIDYQEVTLNYSWGSEPTLYTRRRIICQIDQPLEYSFTGSPFHPTGQVSDTADTYATQVADAAKYYSTKTLAEDVLVGESVIKVDSIYEQLVPASKKQTPLINKQALSQGDLLLKSGNTVTRTIHGSLVSLGDSVILPDSVVPNTLRIINQFSDDGNGIINRDSDGVRVATINYKEGLIVNETGISSGGLQYTYEVATVTNANIQFTNGIKITQENQGLVYTRNISPMPSDTDLYIDYRSQGKWYRFSSNADGTLGNDPTIGAGNIFNNNDGTGSVSLTLGSLPDIDSTLIIYWGSNERTVNRSGEPVSLKMQIDLGRTNIDPLSFAMQAYTPNVADHRTITSDVNGVLIDSIGTINGELDFINGIVNITDSTLYNRFEDVGSDNDVIIDFDYKAGDTFSSVNIDRPYTSEDVNAGTLTFDIGENVEMSSVRLSFSIEHEIGNGGYKRASVAFNNSGNVISSNHGVTGSVNASGQVSLVLPLKTARAINPAWLGTFGADNRYVDISERYKIKDGTSIEVIYNPTVITYPDTHNITDKIENIATYKLKTPENMTGEVMFKLLDDSSTSDAYQLFTKESLVFNKATNNGSGTQVGTIDYTTGEIEITYYHDPRDFYVNMLSLFTDNIGNIGDTISQAVFRTAATKLTTSSLQLRYETMDGIRIATTDQNGVITGSDIDSINSYVDTETGMVNVFFTTNVSAESIRYDAVAESSLPLDPELLGLNPVRLPSDGRVPVFDAGRHLIIFNEVTTAVSGGTPTTDQVVNLARSGQSYIEVIDANGKRLNPTQYTSDKDAGSVTFGDPLVLQDKYGNNLTAPYSVVDRIEDMLLATDVQINGLITLSGGLSHDYTQGITKVASALILTKTGDIGSRVFNLFSQEIWDSGNPVWSNDPIGDSTSSQYDNINYPIQIDNKSSTSGRWAIVFINETTVKVIEEKLGVVEESVSIAIEDVAPINPSTGLPYFTMDKDGFGAGWVTNNVIRLNTDSGDSNMWVIRTVQAGAMSELTDSIELEIRGDAN